MKTVFCIWLYSKHMDVFYVSSLGLLEVNELLFPFTAFIKKYFSFNPVAYCASWKMSKSLMP